MAVYGISMYYTLRTNATSILRETLEKQSGKGKKPANRGHSEANTKQTSRKIPRVS